MSKGNLSLRLVYLSSNTKATIMADPVWAQFGSAVNRIDGEAVEFKFSVKKDDDRGLIDLFALIYTVLGHGMFL